MSAVTHPRNLFENGRHGGIEIRFIGKSNLHFYRDSNGNEVDY